MQALTVRPGIAHSASLVDLAEPLAAEDQLLLETIAVGVCGTDAEILNGEYGWAPPQEELLVLGHESLCRVIGVPSGCSLSVGDLVVPMVRWPDPAPCSNCAVGEWDMCSNGEYTEHGIKQRHGFARERFAIEPHRVVRVDPALGLLGVLLEPASILAKAWEHIERIGQRAHWAPQRALVTGAGPIGLLAALMARQRGLEVDVLDRVVEGPKPGLVRDLGGTYHVTSVLELGQRPDIALECTGVPQLVFDVMSATRPGGIVCLTGVSSGGRKLAIDLGSLNRSMVLENDVVFGSVNANRRHYEAAATALAAADPQWLSRLITRQVPLNRWQEAFEKQPHDVKIVLSLGSL